jgi:RNA-directed DNA polymerase
VKESVTRFVTRKLRLQVNEQKSAVGRPWERKFLGFCFTNSRANPLVRLHWKTIKRFRLRIRELTRRTCGRSLPQVIAALMRYIRGWWQYFGLSESVNRLRPLAHWVRRRLRALIWTQWKSRPQGDGLPGTQCSGSNGAQAECQHPGAHGCGNCSRAGCRGVTP